MSNGSSSAAGARVAYLDHLRWGVIVLVVALHAAVTYSGVGGWYYHEPAQLGAPTLLFFLAFETHLQAFFMGLLFLVSGYFVPTAYDRKGARRFLLDRAFRLGLPVAFYALVLQPINFYAVLMHKGEPLPPFGPVYAQHITSLRVLSGTGPLWFALALLIFTTVYALVRRARGSGTWRPARAEPPGHQAVGWFLAGLAGVTFLVRVAQPIGTDVFNMQLCFFPQYIALFVVGMMARRGDWFAGWSRAFGLRWLRVALAAGPPLWLLAVLGAQPWSGDFTRVAGGWHWPSAVYCLWESLFCVGICLGALVLVRDRANRQTSWTQFLSDNAFAVYVFHAPILIGLTMLLSRLGWPPLAKFVLLSGLSLGVSFAGAALLFRRVPGLRRIL